MVEDRTVPDKIIDSGFRENPANRDLKAFKETQVPLAPRGTPDYPDLMGFPDRLVQRYVNLHVMPEHKII